MSEITTVSLRGRSSRNRANVRKNNLDKERIARIKKETRKYLMNAPSSDIANVSMRLYSYEELQKMARVKITGTDSMNGINSALTGTSDYNSVCKTCHGDISTCPGHLGYIEFVEPIVYPARYFVADIVNLLRSICSGCGSLVLSRESIERIVRNLPPDESRRLAAIAKESMVAKTCHNNPTCKRMRNIKGDIKDKIPYFSYKPDKVSIPITAREILRIFDSLSQEDAELLGYKGDAHPRNLILQGIAVIPPCSRPPAMTATGELKISILTELYNRILVANEELRKSSNKDTTNLSIAVYNLLFRGSADHTIPDNVSIKTKITHKYNGVIRGNINGKNIINSGRGVVIGDPTLKFGEIGFPRELARRMTVSETVTPLNLTTLNTYLRRGLISKYRPLSDPERAIYEYNVSENSRYSINLRPGDVVERQLMEGDYVLSFRQPVLTKLSMLGNRIVLKDGYTFACHMAETTARNMDFDGDEVNVHAPTDISSMNQVATYISSRVNIMDARNNMVSMAVVYDGLISIYMMMTSDQRPTPDEFRELLSVITNKRDLPTLGDRARELGVQENDLISYKMLFSALLPANLYYKKNDVVIVNGVLLQGIVGKNQVGHARDTIIQQILLSHGDQRAADFITDIYFLLTAYLTRKGFSAGYKDILTDPSVEEHIKQELSVLNSNIEAINLLSEDEGNIRSRYVEKRIIENISNYTERLYKYNKDNALPGNRFIMMIDSGAKGKHAEYGGITSFVGQKYSQGGRMKRQLTNYTRSSIYFEPGDNSLSARGFIMNSYTSGLTPQELLFNQIGARDDIVTMMMGTPDVGSLSHQMTRALENMKTDFGSVVNPDGKLVQAIYGGDGMDAERMTAVKTPMGHVNTFANLRRIVGSLNAARGVLNTEAEGVREDVEYAEEGEIEYAMEVYDSLEY